MILKHPTRDGWLIATDEVRRLIDAPHRLILPDGQQVHPLYFTKSDIFDVAGAKIYATEAILAQRGAARVALGLSQASFQELVYTGKVLECQRWQAAPETPFGLAGEAVARGITNEAMAALVIGQWAEWQAASDAIEADYYRRRAAIEAAQSVEEIAAILAK